MRKVTINITPDKNGGVSAVYKSQSGRPMPTPLFTVSSLPHSAGVEMNIHLEIQSSSAPEVFSDPVP